jgi:hypothetical protein
MEIYISILLSDYLLMQNNITLYHNNIQNTFHSDHGQNKKI